MIHKETPQFAVEKYSAVKWLTKKEKTLFPLKDCNLNMSWKIYKGTCSCGDTYFGETIRNVEKRSSEHNSDENQSEPAKHLANNEGHSFLCSILVAATKDSTAHEYLEELFITKLKPSLSKQKDSNMSTLFRNGVT